MRRNFVPTVWGSSAWKLLHIIALSYPEKPSRGDRMRYKQFYRDFGKVLPCDSCIVNYSKHWKKYNIDDFLSSPDHLFQWTILMRNSVQKILKKPLYDAEVLKIKLLQENSNFMSKNSSGIEMASKITAYLINL